MEHKVVLFKIIYLLLCLFPLTTQADSFKVVIDAGHGGRDVGARGANCYEKNINLSVALKLGKLISSNNPDVKVIYTRKTDKFVDLNERANIANRNKADLFISIHTNSVARGSRVNGSETYTLGLAKSNENLEVAMRENSAILLEDNYQQKYEGFDPNSSESYIIFEFMQNKHMEQSILFASNIQNYFKSAKRYDRGVRQAGFLVLRKTSMPSVLIELGFISNRNEENYMRSNQGQEELASCIYKAFCKYKSNYEQRSFKTTSTKISESRKEILSSSSNTTTEKKVEEQKTNIKKETIIYKIQILTSDKKLSSNARQLKGYKNISYYKEKGLYKYTYGASSDFSEIKKLHKRVLKDFKDAFIIRFKNGEKI